MCMDNTLKMKSIIKTNDEMQLKIAAVNMNNSTVE